MKDLKFNFSELKQEDIDIILGNVRLDFEFTPIELETMRKQNEYANSYEGRREYAIQQGLDIKNTPNTEYIPPYSFYDHAELNLLHDFVYKMLSRQYSMKIAKSSCSQFEFIDGCWVESNFAREVNKEFGEAIEKRRQEVKQELFQYYKEHHITGDEEPC